ncbi:MAG: hypothetical protein IKI93_02185, partial [Clostridia bacterium]|nr:hypothetical protein [Clostridia bacterium]
KSWKVPEREACVNCWKLLRKFSIVCTGNSTRCGWFLRTGFSVLEVLLLFILTGCVWLRFFVRRDFSTALAARSAGFSLW